MEGPYEGIRTGEDVAREIMDTCISCELKKRHWKNITLGGQIVDQHVNAYIDAIRGQLGKEIAEIIEKHDPKNRRGPWRSFWDRLLRRTAKS